MIMNCLAYIRIGKRIPGIVCIVKLSFTFSAIHITYKRAVTVRRMFGIVTHLYVLLNLLLHRFEPFF